MSRGLHVLAGGRFYHARAECYTCTQREPSPEGWSGFCRPRGKTLCCEKPRKGLCEHYLPLPLYAPQKAEGV